MNIIGRFVQPAIKQRFQFIETCVKPFAMRIIPASSFKRSTWKNGGGITHEIARDKEGDGFGWRLSIAEVNSDGPFSLFPGFQRCLTVISGKGMELRGPSQSLGAKKFAPVWFSGDEAITGELNDGPCLDFNLIFNPEIYQAELEVVSPQEKSIRGRRKTLTALYELGNSLSLNDLIILETPEDEFNLATNSTSILLRLLAHTI